MDRWIGCAIIALLPVVAAHAQRAAPIADRVFEPLLPSRISGLPLTLSSRLAYLFEAEDGANVVHLVGDFTATLGGANGQTMRSGEAVVWITDRLLGNQPYRRVELFLWREAEIVEIAGTVTSGPALYLTLDCFGPISLNVDEFAFQSSSASAVYRDGADVRKAVAEKALSDGSEESPFHVIDPTRHTVERDEVESPPILHFQSQGEFKGPISHDGQQLITVTGRVYLSRGIAGTNNYVQIQADAAVVFLPPSTTSRSAVSPDTSGLGAQREDTRVEPPAGAASERRGGVRSRVDGQRLIAGFGELQVEGAYLEGDVLMVMGPNMIRASRLYYDFVGDRALILDAVARTVIEKRNIPLYLRAAEIRQLSANHFTARHAILTTSEFHTPHYHVGASRVELINRTPPGVRGQAAIRAGNFLIRDATLNLGGVAIAYWPVLRGTIDTSETAIKGLRTGFSGNFGVELETEWHLFNIMGLEQPAGFDATLSLDYFSDRGPAIGVDTTYQRDKYFGLLRSYLLTDNGEDFLGREREEPSRKDIRGRFLLRHRQYLEDDWEVSLEISYISDDSFLEEFFESEFDNDKEQETLLYLKKQQDNWAFTALLQGRILDFTTQTERMPDFSYRLVGEPVGDRATWFSENRLGAVRFRAAHQTFRELLREGRTASSGTTLRVDSRQELEVPIDVGPWRFVPFVVVRGTAWDDSPGEGGLVRGFGSYGVRGSTYLSRVYPEVKSAMFDIDGVRHLIKPELTAWISHANRDSGELFPFDETVEQISEVDGLMLGVRQRWQTKRGEGKNRRTVDVVTLDTDLGVFNGAESDEISNGFTSYSRPENSISHNYVNSSFIWRINDRTALLSELNYDINDGEVDLLNFSLAVERSPRFSYLLGYRFIEETNSGLLGFDMNYRLTEKHTLALRELFDLDEGRTLDFTVVLIRKFPRWFTALSFALDEAEDDFGVSLSLWPEGLPQAAMGSRRFTGLARTTRINRQ